MLITDAYNGLTVMTTKRNERDAQLFDAIRACLDGGGNCLMPVDTAGRVLELLVLLHSKWVSARLDQSYTIAFASHVAQNTLEFARTYVEWMSEKCQKQFDQMRENPFDLKHVVVCRCGAMLPWPQRWIEVRRCVRSASHWKKYLPFVSRRSSWPVRCSWK